MVTQARFLSLWLLFAALCVQPLQAQQEPQSPALSAFVDRTDITLNDVLTLTIRIDAALGNSRPSLAGLNREFEQVNGLSTRSSYSNTNGTIQSWNEYSIMLRPLTTGALTIPAFRVGSEVSSPIRINVAEAPQIAEGDNDEIFLQTEVSKEEVYVQEQLLYTIRIFYSISFDQGAQLTAPLVADAVVQQLGTDENYQQVVDGIGYNVTERRFVVFPQGSGQLTIPPVYFTASVGRRNGINRLFSNRQVREINLTSDSHNIAVLPRPDNVPGQAWLPAAGLTLEEQWSGPSDNIQVGDAVTRNITLTAEGLSSSLLPAIQYTEQSGLKFYPDQPVRGDTSDRNGVVGKRTEGTAIVASEPGEYLLPEIQLPWWNTRTNTLETAVLPARTIRVVAPEGNSPTGIVPVVPIAGQDVATTQTMVSASQSSGLYLFWISSTVLFAAAWLFSTLMWLRSRRQLSYVELLGPQASPQLPLHTAVATARPLPSADSCLRVLQTACTRDNLHDVRAAVLKWGQASFASVAPMTLEQVAIRCGSERLTALLKSLERTLYSNGSAGFSSKELYEEVAALHKRGVVQAKGADKYALPPLYRH